MRPASVGKQFSNLNPGHDTASLISWLFQARRVEGEPGNDAGYSCISKLMIVNHSDFSSSDIPMAIGVSITTDSGSYLLCCTLLLSLLLLKLPGQLLHG